MTSAASTTTLHPARDARLVPYGLLAMVGLGASLASGQPALAALAAPFVLALALGLRRAGPVEVTTRIVLDGDRVLEGDVVTGRLELAWGDPLDARVVLHRLKGVGVASPDGVSLSRASVRSLELPLRLEAVRWGRHSVGEVWLRLEAPFGLLSWTGKVMVGPAIRVLPSAERLNRLLDPEECRAVWGMHRSRRLGDGHEFAELRPYVPGDRMRDLNWAATARLRQPFVNKHHPDLAGDVLIAIDAFDDGSEVSTEALAKAARVAWALASIHLRGNDRVGLAGLGGSTQWLPPAGGRLARYQLLETLLRIGGEAADGVAIPSGHHRRAVPSSALVIALTPLHDPAVVGTLESWRARGRAVAVVVIDSSALMDEPASTSEALARRLWGLELERRKRELTGVGIPVVTAPVDSAVTPIVSALRRGRRAPGIRRGR